MQWISVSITLKIVNLALSVNTEDLTISQHIFFLPKKKMGQFPDTG